MRRARRALLATALAAMTLAPFAGRSGAATPAGTQPPNLLRNGGFEQPDSSGTGPANWSPSTGPLPGEATWVSGTAHSGEHSVEISGEGSWTSSPFRPGPPGSYRVLGLWVEPATGTEDSAYAQVDFLGIGGADISSVQTGSLTGCNSFYYTWAGPWCYQYFGYMLPAGTLEATVSLVTNPQNRDAWYFDDVFFGPPVDDAAALASVVPPPVPPGTASVTVDAGSVVHSIPADLTVGDNDEYTGTELSNVTYDPTVDNTIRLTSDPPVLRFPGGSDTPNYFWETPGGGNVDIDSFMHYVDATGAKQVLLTLNMDDSLADNLKLLDYADDPRSTVIGPNGVTRDQYEASHHMPVGPYDIDYVELGNETYYSSSEAAGQTPVQWAQKAASWAQAIHAAFPQVKVGIPNTSQTFDNEDCCGTQGAQLVFDQAVDAIAGPYVDFVILHAYDTAFHSTYDGMLAYPAHQSWLQDVVYLQETFARYSPDHRQGIPVFVSEMNAQPTTYLSPVPASNPLYQLADGLFVADEVGVLMDQGASEISVWDQLDYPYGTNVVWPGSFNTADPQNIAVEASGDAEELFNRFFGRRIVADTTDSPTYTVPPPDSSRTMQPDASSAVSGVPWLSSYASLSPGGRTLYVMLVNKSGTDPLVPSDTDLPLRTTVRIHGFQPAERATVVTLDGTGRGAWNVASTEGDFDYYDPTAYGLAASSLSGISKTFTVTSPAHSVMVIELARKR